MLADFANLFLVGDHYYVETFQESYEAQDAVGQFDWRRNRIILDLQWLKEVRSELFLIVRAQILLDNIIKLVLF